jgi:drug/metabolite transporter (DMT)-like permease
MKDLHFTVGAFYYGILGSLVSITFILHHEFSIWDLPSRFTYVDFVLFFCIGMTSAMGALSKALSFQYDKVSTLTPIKYTGLFYSLAADVVLFHSHIYFGEIVGAMLILSSGVFTGILKYMRII